MPRGLAIALAISMLGAVPAAGVAQAPAPATPDRPPALESLRMPRVVTAQQGHARFLVGVRLATPARLTVQVLRARDGAVQRTLTDTDLREAGRAYLRVEAVDASGFQLLRGAYRIRVQATDDQGRVSAALERPFRLRLTTARGLFPVYTVPLWKAFRRQSGTTVEGQLVAVVGPRSAASAAGIRRGDVITSVGGRSVATPGAWSSALRALVADSPVSVELDRRGTPLTVTMTPRPDWEPAPDHARALRVAVAREPRVIAYSVAQARRLVQDGELAQARRRIARWPRSWRLSAPGQIVQAELLAARRRWKPALGAFNRARARDRTMAGAEFGRGLTLSRLDRTAAAAAAFRAAGRLDPSDASAAAFRAYALLRLGRTADGVAEAQRAVRLDVRLADAFLPLGIGLLAQGDSRNGVRMLRRGLILLEEPERADRLIARHLDPTDP